MDDLMKTVDKIRKNREKKLIDTSEQKQIVESENKIEIFCCALGKID
jgi:hypothetical protein